MKKNLLFISQIFPPSAVGARGIQNYRLCSGIYKHGFLPIIFCEKPEKFSKNNLDFSLIYKKKNNYEIYPVASLYRFRMFRAILRIFPFLKKPDPYLSGGWGFLSWNFKIFFKALSLIKIRRINLIISISTPVSSHITGLFLKYVTKLPWVAIFSDAWVDDPCAPPYHYSKFERWLEKKVVEKADFIVFVTKELQDFVIEKYSADICNKCIVIPPSSYPDFHTILPKKSMSNKKVIFRYVGTLTHITTPEPLMSGISMAKKKKSNIESYFQFEFIGKSHLGEDFKKKYNIFPEIIEIPYVTYLESLSYMKGADVLVCMVAYSKNEIFFPSKVSEYLGARKPIFGIVPEKGTLADLIRQANGFLANPIYPEQIANCIIEIVNKKFEDKLDCHVADEELIDRYNAETYIDKYSDVFQKAIFAAK